MLVKVIDGVATRVSSRPGFGPFSSLGSMDLHEAMKTWDPKERKEFIRDMQIMYGLTFAAILGMGVWSYNSRSDNNNSDANKPVNNQPVVSKIEK